MGSYLHQNFFLPHFYTVIVQENDQIFRENIGRKYGFEFSDCLDLAITVYRRKNCRCLMIQSNAVRFDSLI